MPVQLSCGLSFMMSYVDIQVRIGPGKFVALRVHTDETVVGKFKGRLVYPLVVDILNLPVELRSKDECRFALAFFPVTNEHFSAAYRSTEKYRRHRVLVTWAALRTVLRNLFPMKVLDICIGGHRMKLDIILAAWSADIAELWEKRDARQYIDPATVYKMLCFPR